MTPESAKAAAQAGITPGDPLWHILDRMDGIAERQGGGLTAEDKKELARQVRIEARNGIQPISRSLASRNGIAVALGLALAFGGGRLWERAEHQGELMPTNLGNLPARVISLIRDNDLSAALDAVREQPAQGGRRWGLMAVWLEPAPPPPIGR